MTREDLELQRELKPEDFEFLGSKTHCRALDAEVQRQHRRIADLERTVESLLSRVERLERQMSR